MTSRVILASASEARADMLRAAGVLFSVEPARIDEDAVKAALRAEGAPPRDQADKLAEMKAIRMSLRYPGTLSIGADQVLELAGEAVDKPVSIDEARLQLMALRGKAHDLHSAAVIAENGVPVWRHVGRARLTMRAFSDAFLDGYLARMGEAVMQTVGGYMIEREGAQLFSRVTGDHFAIRGLPLMELLAYLREREVIAA